MFNNIFNSQTKNITRGALILGASYFISAILGLIRDRLLAGRFGAGLELDVYFAAFRIPDFVYNILILGGLIVKRQQLIRLKLRFCLQYLNFRRINCCLFTLIC